MKRPRSLETYVATYRGLGRVKSLVSIYDRTAQEGRKRATPATDILRSAVVLLHAVLEEFVRHVSRGGMPLAHQKTLDQVPLADLDRPAKFYFGALANHRGKLVDAVLTESVDAYLNRKSFASLSDVLGTLKMSGIPTGKLRIRSASLDTMIKRRHQIVHEADLVRERWPQNQAPRALSRRHVAQWISAVEGLISEVDAHWRAGRWRVSVR